MYVVLLWNHSKHENDKICDKNAGSVKVKRGRRKGDGKKNARKYHDKSVPFPSNPILSEAPPPGPSCLLKYRKRETG